MNEIKIIKSEKEYQSALSLVAELMEKPRLNRIESDKLELVSLLISIYEEEKYPIEAPSPIEAILFRLEQANLKREDLIPYIGSKSKVSEVLSGKRQLSKHMIKNLHEGLDIPLESLFNEVDESTETENENTDFENEVDWTMFPFKEMAKRQWIEAATLISKKLKDMDYCQQLILRFINGMNEDLAVPKYLRNNSVTYKKTPDSYALAIWRIRILQLVKEEKLKVKYQSDVITPEFCSELAKLSYLSNGPLLAKEFLNKNGIHLIIESHLQHTYLDGAVMFSNSMAPIIGLTLRYDRLDNYWFNLFHELAHLKLHLTHNTEKFYLEDLEKKSTDIEELEADEWARESLIPEEIWKAANLGINSMISDIIRFADSLRINPAIVAGRIRREYSDYTLFDKLIGRNKLREIFRMTISK